MTRAKRVLITGAAGFIGWHLAMHLRRTRPDDLILVDNLQRGTVDGDFAFLLRAGNVSFRELDLATIDAWDRIGQVDEVYHLAAVNGTSTFYTAPDDVLRTNCLSTTYMLDWASSLRSPPRVLFTSSNEAYAGALAAFGQLPIPTPEDVPLVIANPRNPRWSYGASKLLGEMLVIHYAKRRGIPAVVVRPHNFYGPRAGHGHAIPQLITRILERREVFEVYGIEETRSFCYIDDAVDAIARLMPHAAVDAPTVHIGSPVETRISELVDTLFAIGGWRPAVIEKNPSLPGSVARRLPDVSLIERMTGWRARTALEDGLRRTWDWYARDRARKLAS